MTKFHGNILNLSENIAKSFRGATFLTHTVYMVFQTAGRFGDKSSQSQERRCCS